VRLLLIIYLTVYYLLVAAAVVTLWRTGLIDHLPRGRTYLAIAVAIALGVLLALTSRGARHSAQRSETEDERTRSE
jgi:hypothetical protein